MLFGVLRKLALVARSVFIPSLGTIQQDFRHIANQGMIARHPPLWSDSFFFYLSNVISDRMPRVSDVYRAQGATSNISQTLLIFGIIQTLLILGIGGRINNK